MSDGFGVSSEPQKLACCSAAKLCLYRSRPLQNKVERWRRAAEDPTEREWQRSARARDAAYPNEEVECGRELGRWITPFRRCGP